jgi:hypothetical protein
MLTLKDVVRDYVTPPVPQEESVIPDEKVVVPEKKFRCESDAISELRKKEETLEKKKKQIKLQSLYPRIDLSFLSTRYPRKSEQSVSRPRFAWFAVNGHPSCQIGFRKRKSGEVFPTSSNITEGRYSDNNGRSISHLLTSLGADPDPRLRGWKEDVVLSVRFSVLLPLKTREAIEKASSHLSLLHMYLIAEVAEEAWEEGRMIDVDPLVVGINPEYDGAYLIDVFDPTPLEDYVVREFTE